jgi:hypothetical protein
MSANRERRSSRSFIDTVPLQSWQIAVIVAVISAPLALALRALESGERASIASIGWMTLSIIAVFLGPIVAAATLANDRHSGLLALERQRSGWTAAKTAMAYGFGAQRLFWIVPLMTAPAAIATAHKQSPWIMGAPALMLGAHLALTVTAFAVVLAVSARLTATARAVFAWIANMAVCAALVGAWTAPAEWTRPVALATIVVVVATLAIAIRRQLADDEAPFFSPIMAVATQMALAPVLVVEAWRAGASTPLSAVLAFATAVALGMVARPHQDESAQALLRWRLDPSRQPLDPRDPRRSVALSLVLAVIAGLTHWSAVRVSGAQVDLGDFGDLLVGSTLTLSVAALAVLRRADQRAIVTVSSVGVGLVLLGWFAAAQSLGPYSFAWQACPFTARETRSAWEFAPHATSALLIVVTLLALAQRSFARATRVSPG